MTIILTGGGSGGHITPILAVATELKKLSPKARLVYVGQKGDSLGDIPACHEAIDEVVVIRAGKFRRYHGEGLKQLLDVPTMLKNLRDAIYVLIGIWQSRRLIKRLKPSVIFIRGGFVGVPIGLAAAHAHVPYITHDSDAIPSLANRLIAKRAALHAVALPKDVYNYPADKTVTTGIPLRAEFIPVSAELMKKYRHQLDLPTESKVLFIIGGGLGAQRVNQAVAEAVPHLLRQFSDLYVLHATGRANEDDVRSSYDRSLNELEQARVKLFGYIDDVQRYSGAADLIITRAGATNLAEFAVQGKPCLVIPNPMLTGGHQLKNARYLEEQGAARVLSETDLTADPHRLARQVSELLNNPQQSRELGRELAKFAQPDATKKLARLILKQAAS